MILRPYQQTAVDNCITALHKHGNTLLVSATGTGKTYIFSSIIEKIVGKNGKRALVVAHRDELTAQNSETFHKLNPKIPISIYDGKEKSWRGKVTFSMVQTLSRKNHLADMPAIDLIVFDECHHHGADTYRRLTARAKELNPAVQILGVTATPERSDNRGLADTFNNVADIISIDDMVKQGHLVPPRGMVVDIGTQDKLSKVKKTINDYDMAEVEAIQNTNINNRQIVAKWKEVSSDRQSVAFCSTIKHAEDVCEAFKSDGIVSEAVHSEISSTERKSILSAFDKGEIQVLTNPFLLGEGWDCLDEETEILTPNGWKKNGEIKVGDNVYGYNKNTGKISSCKALSVGQRFVKQDEKMLTIESQHVNIRVTEGHNMLIEKNRRGGFQFIKAKILDDMQYDYAIPLAGYSEFKGIDLLDDEIRIIAWYITDGYLTKKNRFEIYQAEHKESSHIDDLLKRLGYKYKKAQRDEKYNGFKQTSPLNTFGIQAWQLSKLLPYFDKFISPLLDDMDVRQFKLFWKELLLGDGENKEHSGCLCTGLKCVADRLCHMATIRGLASSVSTRIRDGKNISYRVFAREKLKINSRPKDKRSARIKLITSKRNEMVWCISNEFKTIVTRRKGKIAIVGNCQICSCIMLLRPCSHKSTMIQMVGRGLRKVDQDCYPGVVKSDCLILDFGTSLITHGDLVTDVELKHDRPECEEERTKFCPGCNSELPIQARVCPLCGFEFQTMLDGVYNPVEEFRLIEIDLINKSPFRWTSLFPSDKIRVTSGFSAWACVCSPDNERWFAIGGMGKEAKLLTVANRIGAISSADDFMRQNETSRSAKKAAAWMNEPASDKQRQVLFGYGYDYLMSKVEAAAHLTFRFNQSKIERLIFK